MRERRKRGVGVQGGIVVAAGGEANVTEERGVLSQGLRKVWLREFAAAAQANVLDELLNPVPVVEHEQECMHEDEQHYTL